MSSAPSFRRMSSVIATIVPQRELSCAPGRIVQTRCTLVLINMPPLNPPILEAALVGLQSQRDRIDAQIADVRSMLSPGLAKIAETSESTPRKRRGFSAATRRKMKAAQQARWAKIRVESEPAPAKTPAKAKRR